MTQFEYTQLCNTANNMVLYVKSVKFLRSLVSSRKKLAKGLRNKYPNMKTSAIIFTLWRQEQDALKEVEVNFSTYQMYAAEVGLQAKREISKIEDVFPLVSEPIETFDEIKDFLSNM